MYILYTQDIILSRAAHIGCVQGKLQASEGVQPTRVDCIILDLSSGGDDDGQNSEDISGPPPDLPSSATVINSMQDALLWAQHQEGATEENIRQIEGLIGLFTRLQVGGNRRHSNRWALRSSRSR